MNILVVEDEAMVSWMIVDMLEERGHSVVGPAPTVNVALELISQNRIDCALLDVNLGGSETAYPIADRLDALGKPYAIVSGYTADMIGDLSTPLLEKPFNSKEFDAILDILIAKTTKTNIPQGVANNEPRV